MSNKVNVLVVEDNQNDVFMLSACLDTCPFVRDYMVVGNGYEALEVEQSSKFKPDIIFLDISMPGMDGHEFLYKYMSKKKRDPAKVVVLTTSARGTDFHKSLIRKASTYIVKPSKFSLLRSYITSVCRIVAMDEDLPLTFRDAA